MKISRVTLNRLHQNMSGAYESFISPVEAQTLVAMIEATERAWWWEEVAGDYGVDFGEPFREECAGRAWEHSNEGPYRPISSFAHEGSLFRYFRDTRWTPPPAPLAVGDVIETVEDLERLPEETLLFSTRLHAYWMEKDGHFIAIGSDRWLATDEAVSYGPFTIRWLPELEADS